MPASDCFGAKDLYEGESVAKVLSTLDGLGGLCQAQGVDVPTFGKNKWPPAWSSSAGVGGSISEP